MARATTTDQQISGTYTAHKNLTNFSMAGWMRRPASASLQNVAFNESSSHRTGFSHFSDNGIYFFIANGSNTFGAISSITSNGWHHFLMTFDGSQSTNAAKLKGFYDGVQRTLTFTGSTPSSTSNNASNETFRIGRAAANNAWSTGDFAEIAMWDATLTVEEAVSLAKGLSPSKIRTDNLIAYLPLIRDINDVVSATTLTDTNTTVATHPRIYA